SSDIVQLKQSRPFSKIEMVRRSQAGQYRGLSGQIWIVMLPLNAAHLFEEFHDYAKQLHRVSRLYRG
ncbi:hypothetical protein DF147_35940, partial [Burkholderia cenocepacia]